MKLARYIGIFLIGLPTSVLADTYLIYMPSTMPGMIGSDSNSDGLLQASEMYTNKNLIITNTDSRTVTTMSLTGYLRKSASDSYQFGQNDFVEFQGTVAANSRVYQDFKGSTLTIRENNAIQVRDKGPDGNVMTGDDGTNRNYDRIVNLNSTTGEVSSEILIAKTQSDYDYAISHGFVVSLEETGDTGGINPATMTTYSQNLTNSGLLANITTNGNFSTNKITSANGASLFRQESDGTVHIGENSIIFADESISNSGRDEIYSSSGKLQLGNNSNHQTIVRGSLEVEGNVSMADPTAPNHGATKGYVDYQIFETRNYVDHQIVETRNYVDHQTIETRKYIDHQTVETKKYVDGAVASGLAIGAVPKATHGNNLIGIGTGYHGGDTALAVGLSMHNARKNVSLNLAVGYSTRSNAKSAAAGVGWGF